MLQLGVIGHPIAQSRSPAMHNAALRALGIDGEYGAFDVAPAGLAAFIARCRERGMRGLSVTIPHKRAALALCEPNELAARVGAVNTLLFDDDGVTRGSNTDVYGFVKLLESVKANLNGRAVVLGAGGAARAIATVLADRGELVVVARRGGKLTLADRAIDLTPWDRLSEALYDSALLIDCTPRGLDRDTPRIDLMPLPPTAIVLDLVVASDTRLTRDARARGLVSATGVEMLLHQGARAFQLWTGREAPVDVMRAALVAAL